MQNLSAMLDICGSNSLIHMPWELTPMERQSLGFQLGLDYPFPLVNSEKAAAVARDRIWGAQKDPEVVAEANRIIKRHTLHNRWA